MNYWSRYLVRNNHIFHPLTTHGLKKFNYVEEWWRYPDTLLFTATSKKKYIFFRFFSIRYPEWSKNVSQYKPIYNIFIQTVNNIYGYPCTFTILKVYFFMCFRSKVSKCEKPSRNRCKSSSCKISDKQILVTFKFEKKLNFKVTLSTS